MNIVSINRLRQYDSLIKEYIAQIALGDKILALYPVGSIYMSVNDTSPSELFGVGVWERINDCFLLASGPLYPAGSTGGESEHTLQEDEIPAHTHDFSSNVFVDDIDEQDGFIVGQATNKEYVEIDRISTTLSTGQNQPHNNMPPYLSVYMWVRTL